MSILKLENISKHYLKAAGAKANVLENINISVESSEKFVSVLAPFSSGKTTLLKIISAIESPDAGKVFLQNDIYNKPKGKIIFIPEKPSSFPWLSVKENVRFGQSSNSSSGLSARDSEIFHKELIDIVGLSGYEDHFPHNESLGFRFRISLARALAAAPEIILLDDPFKRMNSETKDEIYELVRQVLDKYKITFILATTNISEAVYLSNKIYLMKKNPGQIFEEIRLDAETLKSKGLNRHERFLSLRNEIEKSFRSAGENFQTEIHI